MNVNGVGAGIRPNQSGRTASDPAPAVQPPVDLSASRNADKSKGVVRLLQEGHFKGVAEVRLRINFQNEIAQLGADSVHSGFDDKLQFFLTGVQQEFEDLFTAIGATEEQAASASALFDGFKSAINDIANAFLNGGGVNFSALSGQVQSDFDSFIINLQIELHIEPVAPPAVPVEGSPEPEISTENSFLDQFRSAFANHLSSFISELNSLANALPELSGPSGNDAAYSKFLAILEGLNTASASQESALPEILA